MLLKVNRIILLSPILTIDPLNLKPEWWIDEARVGNRKVKLRVDWEPSSGTNGDGVFQVQSGSGKSGYNVDAHLDINGITGKDSILNFINNHPQLRNLSKSVKEEIFNRIWKTYQNNY